jgi:hypothetical protein
MSFTKTLAPARTGLYPTLVGTNWSDLHPTVRQIHATSRPLTQTGKFRVRRGTSIIARLVHALLRVPRASKASVVTLTIEPHARNERWSRQIGDVMFATIQAPTRTNQLRERVGIIDLYFTLAVVDGCLHYRPQGARLALGPISIPLPRWLAPRIVASESPRGEDAVSVSVTVSLPLAGLIIEYDGYLHSEALT